MFWMTPTTEVFPFYVQGCRDAHVALSKVPYEVDTESAYEIVIGGYSNSKSVIRKGKWVNFLILYRSVIGI